MSVSFDLPRFCQYVLAIETEYALREYAEKGPPAPVPALAFQSAADPTVELSIVMPVWNPSAPQLKRALQSLATHDFGDIPHEIVISDDASNNGVLESVLPAMKRLNVRCHRHETNIGGMANFNWCISAARGRWIHMLHQDDWIEPGLYRGLLRGPAQNSDTDLRFCRVKLRDDFTDQTRLMFDEAPAPGVLDAFMERQSISQRLQFAGTIFSRRAVERVGGFNAAIGAAADWEYWARIGHQFRVFYHPGQLATYVLHDASWSTRGAAGYADARAFEKFRLLLNYLLAYTPPERRRTTAHGFLQNMLSRAIDVAQRARKAGTPRTGQPVTQALFLGCQTAGLLTDVDRVFLGV